jgi:L-aminopeptidase/D-esterase-like protein
MIKVGRQNLITDVPGIRVGNFHDQKIRSGVTVITDAALTKPQARRVAIMAQDGFARGVYQAQSLGDLDSYRDRY